MLPETTENAFLYRNATLGVFGHKILVTGNTSDAAHEFVGVTAVEDSVISYVKADTFDFDTYGDATVTSLAVSNGLTLMLGSIKTLNVVSGKVVAYLINKPV
jgi:hypothetical protein